MVHGAHYEIETHRQHNGKIRIRVHEGYDCARITYKDEADFRREWVVNA